MARKAKKFEPEPGPPGPKITVGIFTGGPLPALNPRKGDKPRLIHVDTDVLRRVNEYRKTNTDNGYRPPIIRILEQTTDTEWTAYYCEWIDIHGPSWLATTWGDPLPDRPGSICVLKTYARITLGHGSRDYYYRWLKQEQANVLPIDPA